MTTERKYGEGDEVVILDNCWAEGVHGKIATVLANDSRDAAMHGYIPVKCEGVEFYVRPHEIKPRSDDKS